MKIKQDGSRALRTPVNDTHFGYDSDDVDDEGTPMSDFTRIIELAVKSGVANTVVVAAGDRDGVTAQESFGENGAVDAIFAIASMTKLIVSVGAMQLVEEGQLDLDAPADEILPELQNLKVLDGFEPDGTARLRPTSQRITTRQLLSHTAGFGYEFLNADLATYMEKNGIPSVMTFDSGFMKVPLVCEPGSRHEYGINTDWVGKIIESLSGKRLDDYLKDKIFEPLGMVDTDFVVPLQKQTRSVPLDARNQRGELEAVEFAVPTEVDFCSGGAGLFSTATDYLTFLRALVARGEFNGARILSLESLEEMSRNQIGEHVAGVATSANPQLSNDFSMCENGKFGLGFLINPDPIPGGRSKESLCWAGLFNTYFWIDPRKQICGVFLSQVLPFYDARVVSLFDSFEKAVYEKAG